MVGVKELLRVSKLEISKFRQVRTRTQLIEHVVVALVGRLRKCAGM